MNPATITEVEALAQKLYDQIWAGWYSGMPDRTKATLKTYIGEDSAGFSHSRNLLLNPICDGNLEDADIRDLEGWPIWKVQLVHEMLHEWQYKKPCVATPESTALHARLLRRNFTGEGHGPDFFQAIIEKAAYFSLTPEGLFQKI